MDRFQKLLLQRTSNKGANSIFNILTFRLELAIHGRTAHSPKFSNNSYFFIIRGLKTPLADAEKILTS